METRVHIYGYATADARNGTPPSKVWRVMRVQYNYGLSWHYIALYLILTRLGPSGSGKPNRKESLLMLYCCTRPEIFVEFSLVIGNRYRRESDCAVFMAVYQVL